jgi:hypothetical protein
MELERAPKSTGWSSSSGSNWQRVGFERAGAW